MDLPLVLKRWASRAMRAVPFVPVRGTGAGHEPGFDELVSEYDVIIMKHCFPASDILEDIGKPEPSSPRQSLENYQAVYRLLRDGFDENPDTLFIIWTLPPRHRLFEPAEGDKHENAARATAFSDWLKGEYTGEGGPHPNIRIWDFRGLVADPATGFLKYEYEPDHRRPDSHPNKLANNTAGPELARFIVASATAFHGRRHDPPAVKAVLLHHSTGLNVYRYPAQGLPAWFDGINVSGGTAYQLSHQWYPTDGNMPVHYYRAWLDGKRPGG
jgi:hypothetical protein